MKGNSSQNRTTFKSLEELLGGAAQRCLEVEADLKALSGHGSDPVDLAWKEIAESENRIARLLIDFVRNAPRNILDTRVQYSLDENELSRPDSAEDAAAQLVATNADLAKRLVYLSDALAHRDMADSLEALRREVESVGQQISMARTTMQDI